ncbi:hypothetical protein L0F63_002978, partial [Massospora cicadina]
LERQFDGIPFLLSLGNGVFIVVPASELCGDVCVDHLQGCSTPLKAEARLTNYKLSRAAELLGTGVPVGLTFSSFGQSVNPSSAVPPGEAFGGDASYTGLNQEIQVVFKKLAKRNSTTKLKALDELLGILKTADGEDLRIFFRPGKLSADLERRIRLVANQILGDTVTKVGKQVAPHLKALMGPWLLSLHDPSKDVAAVASSAFEELFPPAKQASALLFAHREVLELIDTNLTVYTPDGFSDPRFYSEEEISQRYTRLIVSTLGAFGFLLEMTTPEARANHPTYSKLLADAKFLNYFSHKDPSIRSASYHLMTRLAHEAPELVEPQLVQFATHFLTRALQEKSVNCHSAMLDAVLVTTKQFPTVWEGTKKPSFARLIQLVNNGCHGSPALVYPALPMLICHLPAGVLTLKGIAALFSVLLTSKEMPTLCHKTAVEVGVTLVDKDGLQPSLELEVVDFVAEKSIEMVSKGQLDATLAFEPQGAAALVLKVMNRLLAQNRVEGADAYANEIEVLIFEKVLEEAPVPMDELRLLVLLMDGLTQPRGNNLTEFATQVQDTFSSILDQVLSLCMEKLDSVIQPGELEPAKAKFINCFRFLCLALTHLTHLPQELQVRTMDFFQTKLFKLIPTYDVGLGLATVDQLWESSRFTPLDLVRVACQPTSVVPYPAKVQLASYLLNKEVALSDLEGWLLTTLQNLMLVPELNSPPGGAWTPGCLESLLARCLVAPDGVFRPEFYGSFAEAFSQNIARFLPHLAGEGVHARRLGEVVNLQSHVVAIVLKHPSYALGVDRLGSDNLSRLIYLCLGGPSHPALKDNELSSSWHEFLSKQKPEATRAIVAPLMGWVAEDIGAADPHRSVGLAEAVAEVVSCLLQAGWPITEIDALVGRIYPAPSTWAELHAGLVERHGVDPNRLSLTYPEGYLLASNFKAGDPPDGDCARRLACLLSFSTAMISSLTRHAKARAIAWHLAVPCFLTDVLFAWVDAVHAGQDLGVALQLDLADSAWRLLESVGLELTFFEAPPAPHEWPRVLELIYAFHDSVPGLTSLAAKLVWIHAIQRQSCEVPDAWLRWATAAASLKPVRGVSLLRGFAHLSASLSQPDILVAFQSDLADLLIALPPETLVAAIVQDACPTASPVCPLLLFHCLLGFPLPRPKCQALNYWAIAVLRLAAADPRSLDRRVLWGLVIPTLEFAVANSYHRPLVTPNAAPIEPQDGPSWDGILGGYATVFDVILILLRSPLTPLAYLIKRNAMALLETLVGLGSDRFSELISWPKYRGAVSEALLELVLAEYPPVKTVPSEPHFGFLSQLSACVALVAPQVLEAKSPTNQLCGLLHSWHPALARCAAKLLLLLLPSQIQIATDQIWDRAGLQLTPRLPLPLIALAQQDPSDASTFGQLLAWLLILRSCELAPYDLKLVYTEQIQASGGIQPLITTLIHLLGVGEPHPFDCGPWDVTGVLLEGLEATAFPGLPLLAAHLYFRLLQVLPSLTRSWWAECSNRNLILSLENYTERHFSGRLVAAAMEKVSQPDSQARLVDEDFSYRVARSEVAATYSVDGCPIEMTLRLPAAYPLKLAEVEGHRHAGIPEKQWRAWLLGSAALLTSQNATLFDALEQFKTNVALHFAGKSECMICYSVVGALGPGLPNRECQTCRNKFHAACLYKWIQSSSQSTCPLCRNLF